MARRLPSLNALRAFEVAARHENFSQAAEELFVTHASISRHVRQLEEWLGFKLFERHSRGVELTDAGNHYARRLTRIFDKLLEATQEATATASHQALSLSVEVTFALRWLVPRLRGFQDRHPEIELNLDPDDDLVDFHSEPAELAIRYGEGDWPEVKAQPLVQITAFPVCSPDYLADKSVRQADDLLRYNLLHEDNKRWWGLWLEEAGVANPGQVRGPSFQNAHATIEAAEADQGFALGDLISTADALKEGWLVRPLEIVAPAGGYFVVRPKGRKESPAARAFCLWLEEEMHTFLTDWTETEAKTTGGHPTGTSIT